MMLHKNPADYGIDNYQWAADRMCTVIEQKWNIKTGNGRLYQLFGPWGLSLQKVHRDYGPANARKQTELIVDLKKNGTAQ